jgi:hypothetical protein
MNITLFSWKIFWNSISQIFWPIFHLSL